MFTIRRATAVDAPAISRVRAAVWPGEPTDADRVAQALALPGRATLVAADGESGAVVAFVDGFLTRSAQGTPRWELDLLATHPAHRGRGIGAALVAACTAAGQRHGAPLARALVQVDNTASQRTFARCGYAAQPSPCALLVATDGQAAQGGPPPPPDLHLIRVVTLSYRGLWLEGALTPASFAAAQAALHRDGLDVAGAVIPLDRAEALRAAQEAGFTCRGVYRWWRLACR